VTDIYKTPAKLSYKRRLFEIAVETLKREGWKVERVVGNAKGSVRRITKDNDSLLISIRTSQDQYVAFPRNEKDTGWGTLEDVDVVIPVAVDDPDHPTTALVHWVEAAEMRDRFDRSYKARREAGYQMTAGRGHWLALYLPDDHKTPTLVGAGVGLDHPPVARVPLDPGGTPATATNEPTPKAAGPGNGSSRGESLTIPEAKRLLAKSLGVPESSIKISIEA
jgi:hypothetical protein